LRWVVSGVRSHGGAPPHLQGVEASFDDRGAACPFAELHSRA
jgi:hypothetical protein